MAGQQHESPCRTLEELETWVMRINTALFEDHGNQLCMQSQVVWHERVIRGLLWFVCLVLGGMQAVGVGLMLYLVTHAK